MERGANKEYCDLQFHCAKAQTNAEEPTFKRRGGEGENNMGLLTQKLMAFMETQGWRLVAITSGNYGTNQKRNGEVWALIAQQQMGAVGGLGASGGKMREQQCIFRRDPNISRAAASPVGGDPPSGPIVVEFRQKCHGFGKSPEGNVKGYLEVSGQGTGLGNFIGYC